MNDDVTKDTKNAESNRRTRSAVVVKRVAVKRCDYGFERGSADFAGSEMPRSSAASLRKSEKLFVFGLVLVHPLDGFVEPHAGFVFVIELPVGHRVEEPVGRIATLAQLHRPSKRLNSGLPLADAVLSHPQSVPAATCRWLDLDGFLGELDGMGRVTLLRYRRSRQQPCQLVVTGGGILVAGIIRKLREALFVNLDRLLHAPFHPVGADRVASRILRSAIAYQRCTPNFPHYRAYRSLACRKWPALHQESVRPLPNGRRSAGRMHIPVAGGQFAIGSQSSWERGPIRCPNIECFPIVFFRVLQSSVLAIQTG